MVDNYKAVTDLSWEVRNFSNSDRARNTGLCTVVVMGLSVTDLKANGKSALVVELDQDGFVLSAKLRRAKG